MQSNEGFDGCPICRQLPAVEFDARTNRWDAYCESDPSVCGITVTAQDRTREELRDRWNQRAPVEPLTLETALSVYMASVTMAMDEPEGADDRTAWQEKLRVCLSVLLGAT